MTLCEMFFDENNLTENNHSSRQINPPKKHVLIVSNKEDCHSLLKQALDKNFSLIKAENEKIAYELLKKNKNIEVVIADVEMSVMDLIREIRKNNKYNKTVILGYTQFGNPEQEEELLDIGVNDFVYKTSSLKGIERRVQNTLPLI